MSWSYDETNLGTSTPAERLNTVRFLVGDTNTLDQQVQDEEIEFALSEKNDNVYRAAAFVCRTIASQYARRVNTELDGALRSDYSDLMGNYQALAREMDRTAKTTGGSLGMSVGGTRRSTVGTVRDDNNRVKPSFTKDKFKNPPNQDGLGESNSYD